MPPIVGVGTSAGGVGALRKLVATIRPGSGIAWVLIQHMAPDRESHLSDILSRETELPVTEVTEEVRVEPDHVYLISPGRVMTVSEGWLKPARDSDPLARRTSIDAFLLSLAEDQGEHCGCALLSGAGTDGTLGLKAVKGAGGLTLTQTLAAAEYDSMLLSALRTGLVDREVPIEEMPKLFVDFLIRRRPQVADTPVADGERGEICDILRSTLGHDFSGYKSSTVDRRIRRRMQMLGTRSLSDYVARLREDKREPFELFRDLLIGVTQFFRDPEAFAAVAELALKEILRGKTADDEVRVWVPGCATGEEAYSLGMLLQEQASGLGSLPELKIFGSDIDDSALHAARLGRYPKSIAADVSPERLERFFEEEDGSYCIRSQLREMCLFAQHNVLRDPPFSRIDMISCRNMLIYMNTDLQKRLMPVFHYALRPNGFLVLGPAESASQSQELFEEVDRKQRIFRRIGTSSQLPEFPIAGGEGRRRPPADRIREPRDREQSTAKAASRRILDRYMPAFVIVDDALEIIEASSGTGAYLELPRGRPRANLAAMVRSELAVDIKASVAHVISTGERVERADLTLGSGTGARRFTLVAEPLPGENASERLCLVLFREDHTVEDSPGGRRRRSGDHEVVRALELELQNTKERLQSTLEELETSNEEMKASNEELSSVNEELQSANEELETSKEELQSINEELRTVNNELSARVDDLSSANADLKNLFGNTRIAMLFLDAEFRIRSFTPPAKPLFRLRDQDVGRPLDELAGRIDYAALKAEVSRVVESGEPIEHEVRTDGDDPDTFIMRIMPYRGEQEEIRGAVLTFIDITARKRDEERLAGMVSELNHRVKNTLASVLSIVRQAQRRTPTKERFAEAVEGQLHAMAAAHGILSQEGWQHAELSELATRVLAPFAEAGSARLDLAGPVLELRPGAVVSLGLILHELATNAAKYGAWSASDGRVSLHWQHVRSDHGLLRLDWREDGGPPAETPKHEGFGQKFVGMAVEHELRGTYRPRFSPDGFACTLELPESAVLRPLNAPDHTESVRS